MIRMSKTAYLCLHEHCEQAAVFVVIYSTQRPKDIVFTYSCSQHLLNTVADAITYGEATYVGVHRI